MSYAVYKLSDPRDNRVRYVGMSKDVIQRFGQHLSALQGNEIKGAWLHELRQEGLMPMLTIIEDNLSRQEAVVRERYWIQHYRNAGSQLTNCVTQRAGRKKEFTSKTEQELKAFLEAHQWRLDMIQRYQTRYAYAKKREGKKTLSRYLTTERKLDELTEAEVLKRIQS
jgi:hypothetical protein